MDRLTTHKWDNNGTTEGSEVNSRLILHMRGIAVHTESRFRRFRWFRGGTGAARVNPSDEDGPNPHASKHHYHGQARKNQGNRLCSIKLRPNRRMSFVVAYQTTPGQKRLRRPA